MFRYVSKIVDIEPNTQQTHPGRSRVTKGDKWSEEECKKSHFFLELCNLTQKKNQLYPDKDRYQGHKPFQKRRPIY